jgi:hypothetical protein
MRTFARQSSINFAYPTQRFYYNPLERQSLPTPYDPDSMAVTERQNYEP